jgi:hypothetical protein
MTKHFVMRECDNILRGYLYVVTTVLSHQDGIYGFKFPNRFSGISCSCRDLTSLFETLFSLLLNLSILKAQPLESMPFPFAFVWLNALQAVRHSNTP